MSNSDDPNSPTLKSDFSTITQTIGRQLHTVASFLAPPPHQQPPSTPLHSHDASPSSSSSYQGFKNDLAEIGDSLKTLLSPKKAVTGISKLASNLIKFDKGDDVVGVTDDVVDLFERFLLALNVGLISLYLFNTKKDHALAIQELVPNLTTLRHTIHNHMTEQQFWIVYFVLLLPRLNADDYRLLSTPQIVQVRETVLQKLRNKKNMPIEYSCSDDTRDEKGSMVNSTEQSENPFRDDATNMIKNKDSEDDETSLGVKQTQSCRFSSASENSDWVRLGGTSKAKRSGYRDRRFPESEESSSDWHAVEDVDL